MIDINSQTWREVNAFCLDGIGASLATLQVHGLEQTDAEYARGMIAALRMVLKLPHPPSTESRINTEPEY